MTAKMHRVLRPFVLLLLMGLAVGSSGIQASEKASKSGSVVLLIEYHHAAWDHYFVTGIPDEISKLDAGIFVGWARTGEQSSAFASANPGTTPTCRFFSTSFAPKSSHFYTPFAGECTVLKTNPDWQFEGEVFNVTLPDITGTCAAGTAPLYRLYNNGNGGAPNHRYVTKLALRQTMLDKGFVAEGVGIGIGMCIAGEGVAVTTAEGMWRGTTNNGQTIRVLILDDGTYYIVYSEPGTQDVGGVLQGSSIAVDGNFTSSNARNVPYRSEFVGRSAQVSGTYVAQTSLQLTMGESSTAQTVTALYDVTYEKPASLTAIAGNYIGTTGHIQDVIPMTASIDTDGNITVRGQCVVVGRAIPRGLTNVFDLTMESTEGVCLGGPGRPVNGVLYYDEATRQIRGFAPFTVVFVDMLFIIGTKYP